MSRLYTWRPTGVVTEFGVGVLSDAAEPRSDLSDTMPIWELKEGRELSELENDSIELIELDENLEPVQAD